MAKDRVSGIVELNKTNLPYTNLDPWTWSQQCKSLTAELNFMIKELSQAKQQAPESEVIKGGFWLHSWPVTLYTGKES